MKVLRTAALVVGAVALAATGAGALASAGIIGAGTGIGASVSLAGLTVTAGTLTSIGALASLAAAGLTALTAKKPSSISGGSQIEFTADPNAGVPYALGDTATAGNIVMRQAGDGWAGSATPNDLNDMVVVLSGAGPIQGIYKFTSDKVTISFDANGNAIGDFKDKMFQKTQLGQTPESAALTVQAGSSARPTGWTTAHKLSGMAAAIWRLRYDTKQRFFQNGVPQPLWYLKGIKVYDPRQDSTYPGGSGPCRAGVDSTYVWAGVDANHPAGENPYLQALTWCLGRFANGKRVMGLGAPIGQIIVSEFVEGANIADLNGWKAGGVVWSRPDSKWSTLKQILQAGMGEPTRVGARIGCLVNTPRVSLATITIGDIVGTASFPAMQTTRNRINSAVPRFRDPSQGYSIVDASVIRVADYIAFDGDEKTKSIEFPLIQDVDQAAVAARYEIENSREFGPCTVPLKPIWIDYKAGDCLTIDTPDVSGQKILLLNREIDPASAVVTFSVRSETDGKHPFALGQTATPPPTPSIVAYDPSVPAPLVGDWTAAIAPPEGGDSQIPAIVVVGAVSNSNADAVLFQYRVHDDTNGPETGWRGAALEPPTVVRKDIIPTEPGSYDVSVQYRAHGVIGDRLVLGPLSAGGVSIDFDNVTGPTKPEDNATVGAPPGTVVGDRPSEDVIAAIDAQILANADNARALLENQLLDEDRRARAEALTHLNGEEVATVITRVDTEAKDRDTAQAKTTALIGAATEDGRSFIFDSETALVAPGKSLAQKFSDVVAEASTDAGDQVTAAIQQLDQVIAGADGSSASSLTQLASQVGDAKSNIQILLQTVNGETSTVMLRLDANGKISGVLVDGEEQTAIWSVKRFVLADPDTNQEYFYVDTDGTVKMHNVEVDTLKFGAMSPEFLANQTPFNGTEGSQLLPGGVIMKWGRYRGTINREVTLSITFQTAFPTSCDSFVPTPYVASFNAFRDLWIQNVGNPTRFGATVQTQAATSDNMTLDGFDWIAFGH